MQGLFLAAKTFLASWGSGTKGFLRFKDRLLNSLLHSPCTPRPLLESSCSCSSSPYAWIRPTFTNSATSWTHLRSTWNEQDIYKRQDWIKNPFIAHIAKLGIFEMILCLIINTDLHCAGISLFYHKYITHSHMRDLKHAGRPRPTIASMGSSFWVLGVYQWSVYFHDKWHGLFLRCFQAEDAEPTSFL